MSKNTQLGNLVNGIFVNSTGNSVGVKTTTPRATLDVNGNIYSNDIWIADTYGILFGNLTTGTSYAYIAGIGATGASSYLSFSTNAGEKMRIDNNGSVGIGTSSPSAKLHTVGTLRINSTAVSNQYMELYTSSGISYYHSQNNSAFYTAYQHIFNTDGASPAERMRITSAGNVGIGTSSPGYLLDVNGSAQFSTRILTPLMVQGTANSSITVQNTADAGSWLLTAGSSSGYVCSILGTGSYANSNPGTIIFTTGSSERMRILSNGNVLIGSSTDTGDKLRVNGSIASGGTSAGCFFQNRVSSNFFGFYGSTHLIVYNTDNGNIGQFAYSNGAYTALSDINKKKDFEQSNIGLNEVLQLKPTLYRMKSDNESSPKELGFIAQEVREFIPQAYTQNGEFIGLTQMPIIAALTKAIQELKAEIDILKNK